MREVIRKFVIRGVTAAAAFNLKLGDFLDRFAAIPFHGIGHLQKIPNSKHQTSSNLEAPIVSNGS